VYSKCPLACPVLSCRPPPVTGIVTVHLPHHLYIKPAFCNFVKQKQKNYCHRDHRGLREISIRIRHGLMRVNTIIRRVVACPTITCRMRIAAPLQFHTSKSPQPTQGKGEKHKISPDSRRIIHNSRCDPASSPVMEFRDSDTPDEADFGAYPDKGI